MSLRVMCIFIANSFILHLCQNLAMGDVQVLVHNESVKNMNTFHPAASLEEWAGYEK